MTCYNDITELILKKKSFIPSLFVHSAHIGYVFDMRSKDNHVINSIPGYTVYELITYI